MPATCGCSSAGPYTLAGGDITVMAPGGEINVGLATPPAAVRDRARSRRISAWSCSDRQRELRLRYLDFQVNESRIFAADGGSILVWSTRGDIDAGRGAKTAISAPPPTITSIRTVNPRHFPARR